MNRKKIIEELQKPTTTRIHVVYRHETDAYELWREKMVAGCGEIPSDSYLETYSNKDELAFVLNKAGYKIIPDSLIVSKK